MEQSLDIDPREHVFALKEKDRVLAVARLERIEVLLRCYYLREVTTDPERVDEGNAATLMQEITDLFKESGDICLSYELTGQGNRDPETRLNARLARKLLEGSGWRRLENLSPPDDSIWALNLPQDREADAARLIRRLFDEKRL